MRPQIRDHDWFAVQAKPRRKDIAAASVQWLGLEIFLPKARLCRACDGVPRQVLRPLFIGCLFAYFSVSSLDLVRYLNGVLRVVSSGNVPVPVGSNVIERELDDGKRVTLLPAALHRARVSVERRSIGLAG